MKYGKKHKSGGLLIEVEPATEMYMKMLENIKIMDWIDVNDRLPNEGEDVICFNGGKVVFSNYDTTVSSNGFKVKHYSTRFDRTLLTYWSDVTHWQPLPEPPKK